MTKQETAQFIRDWDSIVWVKREVRLRGGKIGLAKRISTMERAERDSEFVSVGFNDPASAIYRNLLRSA